MLLNMCWMLNSQPSSVSERLLTGWDMVNGMTGSPGWPTMVPAAALTPGWPSKLAKM
ncbi:hypothetical protein D3C81_2243320 [compost metagenome]